jgi:hypothetical protein
MLLAFIITFICTRGYTRLARIYGWGSASFGGVHAHHLVFGMVVAFAASAAVFGFTPDTTGGWFLLLAALFGGGAALVLDEFALIFHLEDVYWEKQGRKSIDAVVLGIAFGCLFLLHATPLGAGDNATGWYLVSIICTNLLFVLIAATKGKVYFAIFGVFIPVLSIVGAMRLAEPDSLWAKKRYSKKPKKLQRSRKRYARYGARYSHIKEKAWDIIGGKPGRPSAKT